LVHGSGKNVQSQFKPAKTLKSLMALMSGKYRDRVERSK